MALLTSIGVAVAAVLSLYAGVSHRYFAPDACERLDATLSELVVGQPIATRSITESICAHLKDKLPQKPLVLSMHGPPGTGKTFTHSITAQAVYGLIGGLDTISLSLLRTLHDFKRASQKFIPIIKDVGAVYEKVFGNPLNCPGGGCPSYKVLFGLDYMKMDRHEQMLKVRNAICSHAFWYPESIIVIEEYDKMHCETRNMLRQMLHDPSITNVSLNKVVFLLEANRGMYTVQELLKKSGKRESLSTVDAHHRLKVEMYDHWSKQSCDKTVDAAKFINRIDLFIPFFPLERQHLRELIVHKLKSAQSFVDGNVTWSPQVVDYFMNDVNFDGLYAIDGAVDAELALKKLHEVLRAAENDPSTNKKCENTSRVTYELGIKNKEIAVRGWCRVAT